MADKLKLIWVIGNPEGKTAKGRVILWERHPDHPNGEVVVSHDGRAYEVAETKDIKELLGQEILLRSAPRVGWNSKTEAGFVPAASEDVPAKPKIGRPKLRPSTDAEEDAAKPSLTSYVEKETGRVPEN